MVESRIWSTSRTRRIISKWSWCTIFQNRLTRKHWSIWRMSRTARLLKSSTNIHIFFSDMRRRRLWLCSLELGGTSSLLNWCRDSWTFQIWNECMVFSCSSTVSKNSKVNKRAYTTSLSFFIAPRHAKSLHNSLIWWRKGDSTSILTLVFVSSRLIE